ncbi:TPA: restriction endonuclease subunit S [Klebsiella pneumoniae]|uniref:methylation-associated defense system restriction endonuclease subunit S MAD5 n=2 Tax=Enterobacteriaceae TaxID=543 RepID=UPI001639E06C|nr:restriction endonuclease subunit S [Klebsiella pneumoniae]HEM8612118.1 restriction endonuclease subunit S [Citrobacter amalonaticus]MBK1600698.1 restriction endonuclease subunit S [Klebsiella pneumoniae]MCI8257674.1 restriction endonuclease subunit S [Klebsiella pneumoniae]HBR4454658.1 restriction endonuclease subunit S [Klebsiella pneumoniae]HBR5049082.1 restriction endonuclease subunit S [Klebsiella pneumoniae]
MSRKFQVKTVPSSWIEKQARRLDCGPYMSGAMEARELLGNLRAKKDHLQDLTEGGISGIINAGRITRLWIETPEHGYRFLSSTDISQNDLRTVPYIAKSAGTQNRHLLIKENWTLITRSGSVGKMAYARTDMSGMACTEDVLRIIPNRSLVPPGYIYAYLCTKFGVPLVISGTYGSIITHLEPHHIADLPVPRLGRIEGEVHELIKMSADLRTEANNELTVASNQYLSAAGIEDITPDYWHTNSGRMGFSTSVSKMSLRAINYLPVNQHLEDFVKRNSSSWKPLSDITVSGTLRSGPRFKRIDAAPEFGVELVGQGECFNLRPSGRWIAKKYLPDDQLLFPPDGAIMIAAQGCAGEHDLFGRAQFITGKRLNYAYSQHFLRVIADENEIPRGALFAYLNSQIAYRIRKGYQIGSMQQDFHPDMIKQMPVPIIERAEAEKIDAAVRSAYKKFDDAIDAEDEAVALVERTIEEGGR